MHKNSCFGEQLGEHIITFVNAHQKCCKYCITAGSITKHLDCKWGNKQFVSLNHFANGNKSQSAFLSQKRNSKVKGPVAIYLRFTVDGKRTEISTNKTCTPEKWDARNGRIYGSSEAARTTNSQLDRIHARAEELYKLMDLNNELLTAETIKNRFVGRVEKAKTLIEVFTDHNEKMEALLGQDYEKSTLTRYKTCLSHVKEFMKYKYQISDLPVSRISYTFLEDFDYYLRSIRKNGNNCTIKYLKNLGKVIRICLGNGWLAVDPYINYKPKTKQVDRQVITLEELEVLKKRHFTIERLSVVRDVFVFCCYTGLAYADVFKLKRGELVEGADSDFAKKPTPFPVYLCCQMHWKSFKNIKTIPSVKLWILCC